jgi:hypothetical protein
MHSKIEGFRATPGMPADLLNKAPSRDYVAPSTPLAPASAVFGLGSDMPTTSYLNSDPRIGMAKNNAVIAARDLTETTVRLLF